MDVSWTSHSQLHKIANSRRRNNTIDKLSIDGREEECEEAIKEHIDDHNHKLLGVRREHLMRLKEELWGSSMNMSQLEKPFSEAEIKRQFGTCRRKRLLVLMLNQFFFFK